MNQPITADHQEPRISWRRRFLFLAFLWSAMFGLLEGGARLYMGARGYRPSDIREIFALRRAKRLARSWSDRVIDHPYLPYCPKVEPPDVDMRGLRLTSPTEVKPADVFRIFCLGGSTTQEGYPAKLEEALRADFHRRGLRIEVVNAADVSWTAAESLIDFQLRCLPFQPDAVIIYHGVNDVWPAFGSSPRTDYAHWRKRLEPNVPLIWDFLPDGLDNSVAFVQFRAWAEAGSQARTWKQAMMRYVPDFQHDPYHGVEAFRSHLFNLLAVARAHRIPVVLATHVLNPDAGHERLLNAIREVNDVTRSLAESLDGVILVDAAVEIPGGDDIMRDVCHFRADRSGEQRLVLLFAETVRSHLTSWLGNSIQTEDSFRTTMRRTNDAENRR